MNYYDRIVAIERSEYQVTADDIVKLESEYDIKLPEDYKKFLLKYNGGLTNSFNYVNKNLCNLIPGFSSRFWNIERFYEINSKEEYWDLRERVSDLLLDIKYTAKPEWKLWSIALSTSRTFAISLSDDENYGAVYFIDTMVIDEELSYTKVEDSFTDFISNLIPDDIIEPPEKSIDRIKEIYKDDIVKKNEMLDDDKIHTENMLKREFIPIEL